MRMTSVGSWSERPEASRPSDWKHVATQARSALWHQLTVCFQSPPTTSRMRDVTMR